MLGRIGNRAKSRGTRPVEEVARRAVVTKMGDGRGPRSERESSDLRCVWESEGRAARGGEGASRSRQERAARGAGSLVPLPLPSEMSRQLRAENTASSRRAPVPAKEGDSPTL